MGFLSIVARFDGMWYNVHSSRTTLEKLFCSFMRRRATETGKRINHPPGRLRLKDFGD